MAEWREIAISELALEGKAGVVGGPFGSALGRKHYDVARSSAPVTARMSDGAEVFWVRMNNSTRSLPEIQVAQYSATTGAS